MARKRKDAPLVTEHDYRIWVRWVFFRVLLEHEKDQAARLVEIARLGKHDEIVVNVLHGCFAWASKFNFRLTPLSPNEDWMEYAAYQVVRALNGQSVFANSDGSLIHSATPTVEEVLQAAIDFYGRKWRSRSQVPGVFSLGAFEPPQLRNFHASQPYEKAQREYESYVSRIIHEYTKRVIAMHAEGKVPAPSERPNLNQHVRWLVRRLEGKTYKEIADEDTLKPDGYSEAYILKEVGRLIEDIGFDNPTREKLTRKTRK